jgi:DNA polymerase, archaea type
LQDVHETRRLAELVLPTEFYQCQMVPDTLQNLATIGTGEKVNLLFLRAYLRAGHAIPLPQEPRDYPAATPKCVSSGWCSGWSKPMWKASIPA